MNVYVVILDDNEKFPHVERVYEDGVNAYRHIQKLMKEFKSHGDFNIRFRGLDTIYISENDKIIIQVIKKGVYLKRKSKKKKKSRYEMIGGK